MRWTGRLKNKGHPNKPKHKSVSHKSSVAVSADTPELWTKSVYDCKTEKETEEFLRKTQKTRDRDQVTVYMAKWRKHVGKGRDRSGERRERENGSDVQTFRRSDAQTFRRSDEAKTSKTTSGAVTVVGKEESQRQTRRKLRVVQSSVGEGRIL